jgi:uncharacterized protein YjbI with pentapeptide repeats
VSYQDTAEPRLPKAVRRERPEGAIPDPDGDPYLDLVGQSFAHTTLDFTGFDVVEIDDCMLEACRLLVGPDTEFSIRRSWLKLSDLSGVRILRGCSESVFSDCKMLGVDFGAGTMRDLEFKGCRITDLTIRRTRLERIEFADCQMAIVDAGSARLEDVAVPGSVITGLDLDLAQCERVDLRGARELGVKRTATLAGCTLSSDQAMELAIAFAVEAGVIVRDS